MSDGDFGVEGIRYFGNFRAANSTPKKVHDLDYAYNITNGVYNTLRNAGYANRFYWTGEDAWQQDLRSANLPDGLDADLADDVDLFFITTHGGHDEKGAFMNYNTNRNSWWAYSNEWELGDIDVEWLAMFSCSTLDRSGFAARYANVFHRLHLMLGAYDTVWFGPTTEEVGEDFAENLLDGDTVSTAWLDGISDWWADNHPHVLSAESAETWNDGVQLWSSTTMDRDRYHGRGGAVADVSRSKLAWIGSRWEEG